MKNPQLVSTRWRWAVDFSEAHWKNNDWFCKKLDKLRKTEYKIHRPFPGMGKTCGFFSRFWGNGMAAHIAFFCPISAFGYLPCSFYRKSASRTGCTQSLKVWPLALCHYLNDIELRPPLLLSFQQSNMFINRRPAQITNPSQFRNIQLPPLVCRVMPQKCGG